jgi:hypothetical protein
MASAHDRLLLRFLIATTYDECYTDDLIRVREAAAKVLGLSKPPNAATSYEDEEKWLAAARRAQREKGPSDA